MTSYEQDANRLAMQLAAMIVKPEQAAMATDTDTVNSARRGLRQWCRQVLNGVSPPDDMAARVKPRLHELATHPVGVLQILLQHDPPPVRLRPQPGSSDVDTVNERWSRLGREVELANDSWTTADPASRPSGEHAWWAVADVAAVAEAAAMLDWHLAERHTAGRPAMQLRRESGEVHVATRTVQQIAGDGPLPPPRPLEPAPGWLQPQPVPTLGHFPDALTNMGRLVTTALHLRPRTISALIGQHIPVLNTLAGALTADPPPGQRDGRHRFAEALREHGHQLADIRAATKRVQSIEVDDRRPVVQAQAISTLLKTTADQPRWADRDTQKTMLASLLPALGVTSAIGTAVHANVQAGRWLEPSESDQLSWRKINSGHPVTSSVNRATAHARELMAQLPPPTPARSQYRSPHEVLTPQLRASDRTRPTR